MIEDESVNSHGNRFRGLLDEAAEEARKLQHAYIGVEHIFIAAARRSGSHTESLLRTVGLDPTEVRDSLRREAGMGKGASSAFPLLTPRLVKILELAEKQAEPGANITEPALLRAILEEGESLPVRYLISLGFSLSTFLARLKPTTEEPEADQTRLAIDPSAADQTRVSTDHPVFIPPPRPITQPEKAAPGPAIAPLTNIPVTMPTPTLDQYGRDLNKLARLGKLAEAIGRDDEVEQIITVLARTQKSNPLLLGEAGVGKTAIVEGLAWRIAEGKVPAVVQGKRIVELDMSGLTAGTSLRGQFEERIKQVITEATNAPEVILFIDEIHTLVGAGAGSGANDAAQMFKPALARGDISCIGATTQDEYARYIRKDPALERRFSPVTIKELSQEASLAILRKVAPRIIEKQAGRGQPISITDDALRAAVELTDKFVKDRNQPDKSIDAIDIACARALVKGKAEVSAEDVALVVSDWTGIPAGQLSVDERRRYAQMESLLSQRVIGQERAVSAVSRAIRAALAGMKVPNRPVGVFLFMGASGVGKTRLAKELAAFLFNTPDALIRFDMNEYQEKHAINNLIGSPRGYVGSEQGGQFTEALRRKPYSVVLLDEIEKAHPDIFNLFLAVFDDGRISDNSGRVVDCSNAVFILTSNMGAAKIGFTAMDSADLRAVAVQFLRPELVNRITEVVGFAPLGRQELSAILDQILTEKSEALRTTQQITLSVDESARSLVLDAGADPRLGARPLERAVDQMIIQPLIDAIFAGRIAPGEVRAAAQDGRVTFLLSGPEI